MKLCTTLLTSSTILCLSGSVAMALTVDGDSSYDLNDGAVLSTMISDEQSAFSNEFAINSDTVDIGGTDYGFGTITLGDIGIVDGAFQFFYDIQETGADRATDIQDIIISVDGIDIWSYSGERLDFNLAGAEPTDSPLGNGADAILNVPFDLFLGNGFTSDSVLSFNWLQLNDDNGADEWVVADGGNDLDGAIDPVDPPAPVPLPAGLPLLLAGLGGLAVFKRKAK